MRSSTRNSSGISPTGHYVLILPEPVEEKTKGGIILTHSTLEDERRETTRGTVVEVGPTGWKEFGDGSPWAKPGDRVCYGRHAGRIMRGLTDDRDYVLMNVEDILAVLSD